MDHFWRWMCAAIATLGAWLAYALGGWDAALGAMFGAMGMDYITGILVALMGKSSKTSNGKFKSSVAFAGLTKKLLMLIVVAMATLVDRLIGTNGVARFAAIGFYVANEGMSVIENVNGMGVPFPQGLLDTLERLRQRSNNTAAIHIDDESDKKEGESK